MRSLRILTGLCLLVAACGDSETNSRSDVDAGAGDAGADASADELADAGQDAAQDAEENLPDEPKLTQGSCWSHGCDEHANDVAAEGSTPWGKLVVSSIAIGESTGFVKDAWLELAGTLDGQEARLQVRVSNEGLPAGLLPAGSYDNQGDSARVGANMAWTPAAEQCSEVYPDDPRIELRVDSYTTTSGAAPLAPGDAIDFKGRLKVDGAGWSLEIPLELSTFCQSEFHI